MLHCPLPVRLVNYRLETTTGECPDFGTPHGICGEITLDTSNPDYPRREGGITVWPIGILRTCLCGPELLHAYNEGRILKWHRWAEYDLEPALAGYAEEVLSLRHEAEKACDKPLAQWAKALAVSLVGKLGQKSKRWEWCPEIPPRFFYDQYHMRGVDHVVRRYQEIAGYHRREIDDGWASDSVPAMAGWITSSARMRLQRILSAAGIAECYYYDTDSAFCSAAGFRRLAAAGWIKEGELGFLQLKGVHKWMEIRGVKSYRLPGKDRMGGIPGSGKTAVLDAERFRQSLWMSTYLLMGSRPDSLQKITGQERVQPYRHGTLLAGGRTAPLQFNDL